MKLPSSIVILGITYQIILVSRKDISGDGDDIGEADFVARKIKIAKDLPSDALISTLLHEVLHVALYHTGQRDGLGLSSAADEGLVLALETALDPILTFKFLKK